MARSRLWRMSIWCNLRGPGAWCGADMGRLRAALLAVLAAVAPAVAEQAAPDVDWSHARRAWHAAEGWVRGGETPAGAGEQPILVSRLGGACVTLRQHGVTLGSGVALVAGGDARASDAADLLETVRVATRRALEGARDARRRRGDAADAEAAGRLPLLTIDLQVARRPEPVLVAAEAPPEAVLRGFASGFHGLVMTSRQSGPGSHWSWPANSLAANRSAADQLGQLLRRLGLAPGADLGRVGRPGGPRLDRFEVIHLVRAGPGEPLEQLTRGHVVLPPRPISQRTIESLASRLAAHLIGRSRADGSLAGLYAPTPDRHRRAAADADGIALAALALARHARATGSDDARDVSAAALRLLGPMLTDRDLPPQPAAMGLAVLTSFVLPPHAERKGTRDALLERLCEWTGAETSGRGATSAAAWSLVADGLATAYGQVRDPALVGAARAATRSAWRAIDGRPFIGALPWALDATRLLGRVGALEAREADDRLRDAAAIVEEVHRCQIRRPPALGPDDVLGGFDMDSAPHRGAPHPDWRSAQALHVLMAALRDPVLVGDADRDRWLLDCALAARFLAQLAFDRPGCFYVRRPALVVGGVRRSLDDNELGVTPSAMSLLAVDELLRHLQSMGREPG